MINSNTNGEGVYKMNIPIEFLANSTCVHPSHYEGDLEEESKRIVSSMRHYYTHEETVSACEQYAAIYGTGDFIESITEQARLLDNLA